MEVYTYTRTAQGSWSVSQSVSPIGKPRMTPVGIIRGWPIVCQPSSGGSGVLSRFLFMPSVYLNVNFYD